jgi:uncharacterized membrane protein
MFSLKKTDFFLYAIVKLKQKMDEIYLLFIFLISLFVSHLPNREKDDWIIVQFHEYKIILFLFTLLTFMYDKTIGLLLFIAYLTAHSKAL